MDAIEVGDVVQLKSGGPKMVVHDIEKHGRDPSEILITCKWFVGGEVRQHSCFTANSLRRVPEVEAEDQ